MAKRYDAITRGLLEKDPAAWLGAFELVHDTPVLVINSDLSTITAEADKVLEVAALEPWLVHFEIQTRYDGKVPLRLLRYNVLLSHRHERPVHSVVVLLTPAANGPEMSGVLHLRSPDGRCRVEFHYHVVRVWELDPERLLAGGLGTLPLASLAATSEEQMPAIVETLKQRVDPAAASADAQEFWMASAFLASLRFPWESVKSWFEGVIAMKESSMYQGLLDEGRAEGRAQGHAEEARKIVFRLAAFRFGPPDPASRAALEAVTGLEELEGLTQRILIVSSWEELLARS
jgi:predicted transposase YdaD